MKKLLLILVLISIVLISSCNINEPEDENQIEVTYTISGGYVPEQYGDWYEKLIVKNDGTVIKEYKWGEQEIKQIKLSDREIREFKDLIIKTDVFKFDDSYDCENNKGTASGCIVDGPEHRLKFEMGDGKTKTIYMTEPEYAPKELRDIVSKLEIFKAGINPELYTK